MNSNDLSKSIKKLQLPKVLQNQIDLLLDTDTVDSTVMRKVTDLIEAEMEAQEVLMQIDQAEQKMYEDLLLTLQTLYIDMEAKQDEILAEELEKAVKEIEKLSGNTSHHTPISQN